MTDDRILQVIHFYDGALSMKTGTYHEDQYNHLKSMIPKMKKMLIEGKKEKLMRWLGFMQGALWVLDDYTIDELRYHNMPDGEEFKERESNADNSD